MEQKLSEIKLPQLRFVSRRSTKKKTVVMPINHSPVLPQIQPTAKSYNVSRIHSPDYSSPGNSPKFVHLPSKLLNPSLYLKSLKESPIRPLKKVDSLEEDKELQSLIVGMSPSN